MVKIKAVLFGTFASMSLLVFIAPAFANNAADVATEQYCQCGTCATELGSPLLTTFDARAVGTSSGNVSFQCHFTVPEGYEPDRAIVLKDVGCNTPFGAANKSSITISPGGQARLTCQVNPSGD